MSLKCGSIRVCMLLMAIQCCGSAAASSTDKLSRPLALCRGMNRASSPVPVWRMTKTQLLAEATSRGLAVNPRWTCPELRTVLTADAEYHKEPKIIPKGLSSMTLAELRNEAEKLKIPLGVKETRGSVMLKVRDAVTPDSTVMAIGRFRGTCFIDIPENYAQWASDEEKENGDNMSPDLKRFVLWRRHRRTSEVAKAPVRRGYRDPEKEAKVPPPPMSETGSSPWAVIEDPEGASNDWRPITPSASSGSGVHHNWTPHHTTSPWVPKAKATRRPRTPETKGRMEQDIDPDTLTEIQELEARLAVLKDKCGIHGSK